MSDNKKKRKNASGGATSMKNLRQTTLLGSAAAPSPTRPRKKSGMFSPKKPVTPKAQKRKHVSESSESSDIGAIKLEPVTPTEKADNERNRSESPMPSRTKKRRIVFVESRCDEDESRSSDSEAVVAPRRRRLQRQPSSVSSDSSEATPEASRRRLKDKGKAKQSESDEDLSGEVDKHRIIESRLRIRDKKTAFQKNLERLKRRKSGKPMSASESSEKSEEESEEEYSKPFKGAKSASSDAGSLFSEDGSNSDDSSGFIVEDDGQAVATELPSEFSMRSHDDLSHQFKIIFQFFVHIAVRPSVDRRAFMDDQMKAQEYFAFPLKITRRKLSGLRDSLVASSVWRPKFKKALEKYPTFEHFPLNFAVPSCDACHLGGRLSTILGRLGGIPYDKRGFMDLITSDSEEDSGGDLEASVTRLKKSKFGFLEFHLGRFCARRVRVYHEFCHWEYHLFNMICSEVEDLHAAEAKRGFVRVAFAGGKKPPKDLTDADGICEWLDERGFIDQEWHKIKTMMASAHNLEVSAKRGEED
ncbi:hypothetical protein AN958_05990 [Leucoagaricus sp. SymC.cos]|nr:hypothetical protein AN958_05990 [Leucoagaricus sp. SymC.cos]